MFIQSQHDSSIFLICGHHRKIFFPVFPLKYVIGTEKSRYLWWGKLGTRWYKWGLAIEGYAIGTMPGKDRTLLVPSLDMDHNICPLFKGIFKSLFIELLGGLLGVCRQKSRYQWTQVKQTGFQDFLAWWLSFSINILSIMIPRFWNRHGCHTTNSFVGPKAIKHQQTFFDVLGEPLGYPVGTFGKHSQRPFHRYLRCLFWVTAHTLALYSFIYKILFSFILFLFI